jgi:large subunit ribosomal protein L9
VIMVKAGDQGRLFGSVTASDVADAVNERAGTQVGHRQVALSRPIREVGSYNIEVSLTRNVKAQVAVEVKNEDQPEQVAVAASTPAETEAAAEAEDEPVAEDELVAEDESAAEDEAEDEDSEEDEG